MLERLNRRSARQLFASGLICATTACAPDVGDDGSAGDDGEASASTERSSRCPKYSGLNHGVGSWFEYKAFSEGETVTSRATIEAIEPSPAGPRITVVTEQFGSQSDLFIRTTGAWICDDGGMRLLSSETDAVIDGEQLGPLVRDFREGMVVAVWDMAVGRSWTSSFKFSSSIGSEVIRAEVTQRYRVLGEERTSTSAGAFDAIELEMKQVMTLGESETTLDTVSAVGPDVGVIRQLQGDRKVLTNYHLE